MKQHEGFNLTKKLHTDVLEEKYGVIHPEVLRHDEETREVHMLDKDNISRTYALTFFAFDRSNLEIAKIDEEIKNGGLIGKTFRDHGYEVRKNVISVFVTELPAFLKDRMQAEGNNAKVRLSEFYAKKQDGEPVIYGVVSEVYSPDFRPAEISEQDILQDNPPSEAMERAGIAKEEIWDRLGEGNNFSDIKEKFQNAKVLGEETENEFRNKVETYLKNHEN